MKFNLFSRFGKKKAAEVGADGDVMPETTMAVPAAVNASCCDDDACACEDDSCDDDGHAADACCCDDPCCGHDHEADECCGHDHDHEADACCGHDHGHDHDREAGACCEDPACGCGCEETTAIATTHPDGVFTVYGNEISAKDYAKACANMEANRKKFGDDSCVDYHLMADIAPVVGPRLGVRRLSLSKGQVPFDLVSDSKMAFRSDPAPETSRTVPGADGRPVIIGNIRMGFGHYRISMAMASCARAMGYTPYWFDLCGFEGSTCTKLVESQNNLYSMGSRLSQKVAPFNALYWEPLNSEGFRQLTYNAGDQQNAKLMVPVYADLPKDVPFVATHAWPAQAAIHAGLTHVVNAIPDNWPMALHLAEGAIHAVQTPGAYLGYKMLRGMDKKNVLKPMPANTIVEAGHYIDHELVEGIQDDCLMRLNRAAEGALVRYLICVGGAGAQQDFIRQVIDHLMPLVEAGEAAIMLNVGDHVKVWKQLVRAIPQLKGATTHFNDFDEVERFAVNAYGGEMEGVHAFCNKDIFAAVYSTNLLMRVCDVMVTKPSELAYYPVPKIMIKRVGGHEAWGAIRAAELGDGTYELSTPEEVCAMIDVMQEDRSILVDMCDHIMAADEIGTYDGAYRAVQMAVDGSVVSSI